MILGRSEGGGKGSRNSGKNVVLLKGRICSVVVAGAARGEAPSVIVSAQRGVGWGWREYWGCSMEQEGSWAVVLREGLHVEQHS